MTGSELHVTPSGPSRWAIVQEVSDQLANVLAAPGHDLTGFCWCQPTVEDVLPEGRLYIHRRTLDSPHIERTETE